MEAEALKRIRTVTHCLPKEVDDLMAKNGRVLHFDFYIAESSRDPFIYEGYMMGPPGSPWEGFYLWLTVMYPKMVSNDIIPIVKVKYPMFHPNVWADNRIVCMGSLSEHWSHDPTTCNRSLVSSSAQDCLLHIR